MFLKDLLEIFKRRLKWFIAIVALVILIYVSLYISDTHYWIAKSRVIVQLPRAPFYVEQVEWLSNYMVNTIATWQTLIKGSPVIDIALKYIEERYPGTERELLSKIKIIEQPNTSIVTIEAFGQTAEKAAYISAMIAKAAQEYGYEKANTDLLTTEKKADELIEKNKKTMEETESKKNAIQADVGKRLGTSDIEREYTRIMAEVTRLEARRKEVEVKIEGNKTKIGVIHRRRQFAKLPGYTEFVVEKTSKIIKLEERIDGIKTSLKKELKTLTEEHPRIKALNEELYETEIALLDAKKEALIEELDKEEQKLKIENEFQEGELKHVDGQLEEVKTTYSSLTEPYTNYKKLDREYEDLRTRNSDLTKLVGHLKTSVKGGYIHVHEYATANRAILSDKSTLKLLPISIVLAIMLGIGGIYTIEMLDSTIRSDVDVKRMMGYSTLGIFPYLKPEEVTLYEQAVSPLHEIFDTAFTIISSAYSNAKILICTSTTPEEGKSTIASNLAITIAQRELKVCLVDFDTRKPTIYKTFSTHKQPGLTDVCYGKLTIDDAITKTKLEDLYVLPAGESVTNQNKIFKPKVLQSLFTQLKEKFDYIIIDTPPISLSGDALKLSNFVDGFILVIEAGKIDRKQASWTKHLLNTVKAKVLGALVNKSRLGSEQYYYYYRYYKGK